MAKNRNIQNYTNEELNRMRHKGVAAGMVLQSCFAQRVVTMKNKPVTARKMKHKNRLFD